MKEYLRFRFLFLLIKLITLRFKCHIILMCKMSRLDQQQNPCMKFTEIRLKIYHKAED
jgi:hypothetical protein